MAKTKKATPKEVLTSDVFFQIGNNESAAPPAAQGGKDKKNWNQKLKELVHLEADEKGKEASASKIDRLTSL